MINLRGAKCPTKLNNNLDNEYSKLGILPSPLASPLGRRLGNFEQDFPNPKPLKAKATGMSHMMCERSIIDLYSKLGKH
ncbi:MAG: hypothetical protein KME30_17025 [Iphinoe sp. HA4291-MV1]|nr:hypothetical protein [Iphinoe sp. HA4291-MV1]